MVLRGRSEGVVRIRTRLKDRSALRDFSVRISNSPRPSCSGRSSSFAPRSGSSGLGHSFWGLAAPTHTACQAVWHSSLSVRLNFLGRPPSQPRGQVRGWTLNGSVWARKPGGQGQVQLLGCDHRKLRSPSTTPLAIRLDLAILCVGIWTRWARATDRRERLSNWQVPRPAGVPLQRSIEGIPDGLD